MSSSAIKKKCSKKLKQMKLVLETYNVSMISTPSKVLDIIWNTYFDCSDIEFNLKYFNITVFFILVFGSC